MKRIRLDERLIEQGIVSTKQEAFVKVTEGSVLVDGQKAVSPAQPVKPDAHIVVRDSSGYVGRGALKLEGAIEHFKVQVTDKICADIGAATGGFTEILLKYGAAKVYAIDTAQGKLALKIREDPRVVVMERADIRDIASLPEEILLAVIDVSLISLKEILTAAHHLVVEGGEVIALLKPQYETRDNTLLRRGVIEDAGARDAILQDMILWAGEHGWNVLGHMESPIQGMEGNVEYLLYLKRENI